MDGVAEPALRSKTVDTRWYRALGLGGIHSLLRLALSFITIKFTAIYLGPAGVALVAQLSNFISICQGLLGGGLGTATARLYPEFRNDRARRRRFLTTGWRLGCVFAVASMVVIALVSGPVSQWLLTSEEHRAAVMLAGVAVGCLVLNTMIMASINGSGELGRVVMSNVIASAIGCAVYVPASVFWGISGGLIGCAVSQTLFLPVALVILRSSRNVSLEDFRGAFDRADARRILSFVPMLIAHSVMSPLGLILIRDMVASRLGLETAGLWQATWRISEIYLGIFMASLTLYFHPRLGEVVGTPGLLREEIVRTFTRAVGMTAAVALALFFMRDWVVRIVFTEAFLPVRDLMPIQLLGDVLRMAAWTLGFVLVALVRSRWYIALEILIPLTYLGAATLLVPHFGVKGVTWAYCVAGSVHFAISTFALRDVLLRRRDGPGLFSF